MGRGWHPAAHVDPGRAPGGTDNRKGRKERVCGMLCTYLVRVVSRRIPRLQKEGPMNRTERHSIPSLTSRERQRGSRALEVLNQLDHELFQRRSREPFSPSWKLLDQAREERTGELMHER